MAQSEKSRGSRRPEPCGQPTPLLTTQKLKDLRCIPAKRAERTLGRSVVRCRGGVIQKAGSWTTNHGSQTTTRNNRESSTDDDPGRNWAQQRRHDNRHKQSDQTNIGHWRGQLVLHRRLARPWRPVESAMVNRFSEIEEKTCELMNLLPLQTLYSHRSCRCTWR